jgi:O-antigen/teichoic acid export membrane protein
MSDHLDIKKNMTQGLKWASASQGLNYLIQFVVWAILARLLPSSSFGALSIAMVVVSLAGIFNELGMSTAIVQRKDLEQRHLVAAFWICVSIGGSFLLLALTVAPFSGRFFGNATIMRLVMILAVKYLVDSFGVVPGAILRRGLSFRTLAIIDIWSNLTYSATSLILALSGMGIVAVGLGYLCSSIVNVSQLWARTSFRPNLSFDKKGFLELFHFGRNILAFKAVNYFTGNTDVVLVGKFLGTATLGYYSLASSLANFPRQRLSQLISNIAFPAFSRMQEDLGEVRRGYLKIVRYAAAVNFPLLIGLMLLASHFVVLVYSAKWSPMIVPLRILCVYGMFFSLTTFIGTAFEAVGRPDYSFKYCLLSLAGVVIAVLSGLKYGLTGIAAALSVYAMVMNLIGHIMVKRIIHLGLRSYYQALIPAAGASVIMAAGILGLLWIQVHILTLPNLWFTVQSVLAGAVFYTLGLNAVSRQTFREMLELGQKLIKRGEKSGQ